MASAIVDTCRVHCGCCCVLSDKSKSSGDGFSFCIRLLVALTLRAKALFLMLHASFPFRTLHSCSKILRIPTNYQPRSSVSRDQRRDLPALAVSVGRSSHVVLQVPLLSLSKPSCLRLNRSFTWFQGLFSCVCVCVGVSVCVCFKATCFSSFRTWSKLLQFCDLSERRVQSCALWLLQLAQFNMAACLRQPFTFEWEPGQSSCLQRVQSCCRRRFASAVTDMNMHTPY